jgi:hypothetical protein
VDEPKQGLGCIEYRKSGVEDQKKNPDQKTIKTLGS